MSAPTFRSCALLLYRGGVRLSHNTTPFTARTVSTIAAAAAAAATANRSPRISACPLASPSPSPSPPQQQKRRSSFMSVDKAPAPEMVPRTKVTMSALQGMYSRGEPITMVTAHDYPSALAAEATGIDVVLVGDSLAMVALGMDSTTEIDVDDMLAHCRAVTRAARNSFVVADLPMGSYEISPEKGLETAIRFIKEGRAHAVKLEGGSSMAPTVGKIVKAGIPVMAHIGLTPQRMNALGGFRVQGKTANAASQLLEDATAVQDAGCFAVVIEAVPGGVAEIISRRLIIPTIGIGSGNGCAGQVLVQSDLLGQLPTDSPVPKFVKKYSNIWAKTYEALADYREDVKTRRFPSLDHTYPIREQELEEFARMVDHLK